MHDKGNVAVSGRRKSPESGDDGVLPVVPVAVALFAQAQHELYVVYDHMSYVVHVSSVLYCLLSF